MILKKILKLIHGLSSNKAHRHDGLSIIILKVCGPSMTKPLSLLFGKCLRDGFSLTTGKKQMLFQCMKKGNKKLVSNYRLCIPFVDLF